MAWVNGKHVMDDWSWLFLAATLFWTGALLYFAWPDAPRRDPPPPPSADLPPPVQA